MEKIIKMENWYVNEDSNYGMKQDGQQYRDGKI